MVEIFYTESAGKALLPWQYDDKAKEWMGR